MESKNPTLTIELFEEWLESDDNWFVEQGLHCLCDWSINRSNKLSKRLSDRLDWLRSNHPKTSVKHLSGVVLFAFSPLPSERNDHD